MLTAAGFRDVRVTVSPFRLVLWSADDWLAWVRSMALRGALERLSPADVERFTTLARRELGARAEAPTVHYTTDALFATARA